MVLWFAGESRQIPAFRAACSDSNWMAWFTSLASKTPNPPNCFFVSAYGPSVMDTLLAEPEIDNAPAKLEKTRALMWPTVLGCRSPLKSARPCVKVLVFP
jgi:hypothetical protein